jgi:hypothetical protein
MTESIKGLIVYRPSWKNAATGNVTLEEARVVRRDSTANCYVLAFKGKTGKWREKQGWVYSDVYASPEHYAAARKAREQSDRVAKLERIVADVVVSWWDPHTPRPPGIGRVATCAKRLASARARLVKLEAKRDKLAGPLVREGGA